MSNLFLSFSILLSSLLILCQTQWQLFDPRIDLIHNLQEKHLYEKEQVERVCLANTNGTERCPPGPPPPPSPDQYERWISVSVQSLHDRLYRLIFNLILDKALFFNEPNSREEPPFKFTQPQVLSNLINFTLGRDGVSDNSVVNLVEKVIEYSPHTSHPYYLHRRTAGLDPWGIAADWMEGVMSGITLTYLFGPVYTLMEYEVFNLVRRIVGYDPNGRGDGVRSPTPTLLAIQLAVQKKYPTWRNTGWGFGQKVAIFMSDQADYEPIKGAIWIGMGTNSIIQVKSDHRGRMSLSALNDAIKTAKNEGREPLMIIATAGTPILGAIDDLSGIAGIAEKHRVWYHVEASCGGSLMMSNSKKKLLKGIERSNSFSWAPCCLFALPFISGMLITKEEDILRPAFHLGPNYVHEKNHLYNISYDLGQRSIQTGRRPDIFKLWLMLKIKGRRGLGAHIDCIYGMTEYVVGELLERKSRGFVLILDSFDTPFVSFYFIPARLKHLDRNSSQFLTKLNSFTDELKNTLLLKGIMVLSISISPWVGSPNFYTLNLANSALTPMDVDYILEQIENYGNLQFTDLTVPVIMNRAPFVSAPIAFLHRRFYRDLFELFLEKGVYFQGKRDEPSIRFRAPEILKSEFDFTVGEEGISERNIHYRVMRIMDDVIRYSAHQAHPHWFYQLLGGLDPFSIMGDIVLGAVSSPQVTYEDNPAMSLMEDEITRRMIERLGWAHGEGLFPDGGSYANILAVRLGIHDKFPITKSEGLSSLNKKLVYFISKDAHYSQNKSSFFNGIGLDNAVSVDIDPLGKMDSGKLRKAIEDVKKSGRIPFLVGATAGTTILGAYENLEEIAAVCKEYKLWFHVDGTLGGSVIMSDNPKRREILKGVEKADSFTLNPSKMLSSTTITTIMLINRPTGYLKDAFGVNTPIDFDTSTTLYDKGKWDHGDQHLETYRRGNVIKFYLMWFAKGTDGFTRHFDYIFENVRYAMEEMVRRPGFEILLPHFQVTNVVFMYVPLRIRDMDKNTKEFAEEMEIVGQEIQARLVLDGILVIVAQHEQQLPLQFKFNLMSSGVFKRDIDFILDQIDRYGKDL